MANHTEPTLLLGSYGRGNIGDDAFLLAALQLFRGSRLYINSADDELLPASVRGKVTTIATSGNKDLLQKLRVFRSIRHIVYCGGDLWVELYGDRHPRQSLYKMIIVNLIARLLGKKVHYLGVGIGPLYGYSLFLARFSARLANSIAVREHRSAKVLGLKKIHVLPDLVTTLDIRNSAIRDTKPKHVSKKCTIGISILYHLPDPEKNFPILIKTMAEVLNKLPSTQYRIVLFPMLASPAETHDDVWASTELEQALPDADVSIFSGREVDEYVSALTNVDLIIGARLHANIIAMLAGVPTLGISYRPKVAQFFAMNGLEHYCIDLAELTPSRLAEKLQSMHTHREQVAGDFSYAKERISTIAEGYRNFVATHF